MSKKMQKETSLNVQLGNTFIILENSSMEYIFSCLNYEKNRDKFS